MIHQKLWMGLCLLLSTSCLFSQDLYSPVVKGQAIPDVNIQYYEGGTTHSGRLSDFRGKLLIIDFWSTTCPSCLSGMEEAIAIQKTFGDRVAFLLVTSDSIGSMQRLIEKGLKRSIAPKWIAAAFRLPIIYGDNQLNKLFPHRVYPTHVWIDTLGQLFCKAYGTSTTRENINRCLSGRAVRLDEQKTLDLTMKDPLSWLSKIESVPYYSFLFNAVEYGGGYSRSYSFSVDSIHHKERGFACLNLPLIDLYKLAYKDWRPTLLNEIPINRIRVITKDSSRYFSPTGDDQQHYQWFLDNSYCFAFQLPPERSGEFLLTMRSSLDYYLNIKSKVAKIKTLCWVLKQKPGSKLQSKTSGEGIYNKRTNHVELKNADEKYLYLYLENVIRQKLDNLPLIDETGIRGSINLDLNWEEDNKDRREESLQRALKDKGLILIREYRNIPILVLRDK